MKDLIEIDTNKIFDRQDSISKQAGDFQKSIVIAAPSHDGKIARIGKMIETEIDKHIKSKKWNYLPKCVKWTKIQNYATSHNISRHKINNLKKLISCNQLSEVSYDHITGEIKEIPSHYLTSQSKK